MKQIILGMTYQKLLTVNNMTKKERLYSLYRHTSPSGKVYIGITSQPVEHRWNRGRGYMNTEKTPFKSTIIKYGWDNIKHEVLFTNLSEKQAKHLEIELVRHYKNLGISLNYTDGGDGCHGAIPWNKGIKVPYEQSNKRKGCHLTEEHKQKLSIAHKGKHYKGHKWTKKQREKLIAQRIGKHHTEEAKNKISQNSAMSRRVVELDSLGNIINTFKSAADAGRHYNINGRWISRACRENLICCGHIFMYEDEPVDVSEIKYGRYRAGSEVVIKNVFTDEIKQFHSLSACTRYFNINNSEYIKKVIKTKKLIKGEWKVIGLGGKSVEYQQEVPKTAPKSIKCKNVETGEEIIFPSIARTIEFLGLRSNTTITKIFNHKRSSNVVKGWEVNYAA